AAKTGDVNAVKLRLSVVGDVEYKDINNYTALGWAAANGHIEVVQLLLEKGANIEAPIGNTGITALYIAAQNRCEHIVKLLLEKGANM
ncbi:ankyrin repeat protein, partial [Tirmania nivea]